MVCEVVLNMTVFNVKEALANGAYVSGTTGSGKSDQAMTHADAMMQAGVTVIVFDATRDWINRSSIPHYITVLPNVPFSFKLNHTNIIFDMSLLAPAEQKKLVKYVCETILQHQIKHGRTDESPTEDWIYVIFEEAHIYFPQGCMRAKRYDTLVQFATAGRNFATRFEAVVQFSSMIDKDIMKYMKQRYFGYTDEPNDVDYVTNFMGRRKEKGDYAVKLMNLKAGQFIYKHGHKTTVVENQPYIGNMKPQPLQIDATSNQTQPQQTPQVNKGLLVATLLGILGLILFIIGMTIH